MTNHAAAAAAERLAPARILLAIDSLQIGGAERHTVALARALLRRGHHVAVACSTGGPLAAELAADGIPIHILMAQPVKRRVSLRYADRLRAAIRQERSDLVHAHLFASAAGATLAAVSTGTPTVVTEHSEGAWQGGTSLRVSRWTHRRAEACVAVSAPIRRRLVEDHGVAPEKVMLVHNAIPRAPAERGSVPEPTETGPLIGVVARLQTEKGVDIFLEAAARIATQRPECRFVVIGDGPHREALERDAGALGLHGRLRFCGLLPDARPVIRRLDLLVVPSRSEGTPLVVLEGMESGVPIVASAAGGIPEQIRHGQEGLLVSPADARAFAAACLHLLRNPGRARRLGDAGRSRVRYAFDHDAMVDRVEGIYRLALSRRPGGRPLPVAVRAPTR